MSTPELEDLLARHFEGTLDDAAAARLDELLADDPAAFERFRGLLGIHGLLRARETPGPARDRLEHRVSRSVAEEERRRRLTARVLGSLRARRPAGSRPWAALLLAAGALAAIALVLATRSSPRPAAPEVAVPAPRKPEAAEEKAPPRPPEPPRPEPERPKPTTTPPPPPAPEPPPPLPPERKPDPPPAIPEPSRSPEPPKTAPEPPRFRAIAATDVRGTLLRRGEPLATGAEIARADALVTSPRRGARLAAAGFAVTLERGSTLLLEQEVGGAMRATLASGAAFFEVDKRTAPFTVSLGAADAIVVGTSFQAERGALSVLEGAVRLRNEKGEALVRAGQRSTLRAGERPSAPAKADVEALTAWRKRPELLPNPDRTPYFEREPGANRRWAGLVLASPFGSGEAESEKLARATAERMDAGLVVGHHWRDPQKKTWINVDRAMEAPVRDDGTPGPEAFTDRARKATADYLAELRAAAGAAPREAVPMIVQFRTHYEPGLDACEVASAGWNRQTIAALKALYPQLLDKHRPATRIEMRFQGADDTYEHQGARRAFLHTEADARIEGTMAPRNARNAVVFFFKRADETDAYAKILAEMIEFLFARRR